MRGNNRRNVRLTANPTGYGIQRRTDHFRNRPLNTSRPPSMHVDEFEKQFNENSNGNNATTTTSSTNNTDNNSGGKNGNEHDLLSTIPSSNDGGSDRVNMTNKIYLIDLVYLLRIVGLVVAVHQIFELVHHQIIVIHSH